MKNACTFPDGRRRILLAAFVLITLQLLWALPKVQAQALYFVDTTSDTTVRGGCINGAPCSLRDAIGQANANPGDDGIIFDILPGDPNCVNGVCTVNLTSALPDLTTNMSISGRGVIVRPSNGGRVFLIGNLAQVTLSGLTIRDGVKSGVNSAGGAGILNINGTLNIVNCTITGNTVTDGGGGGIENGSGTTNVINSTISGNSATGSNNPDGGGIYNSSGTVTITNSTIGDNSAGEAGGGVYNIGATIKVTNSTICNNHGGFHGGGIENDANGTVYVKSSIIALNSAAHGPDVYASAGAVVSAGFNLVGATNGSFTDPTDQTGTSASPLDPKLDPAGLKDNGGPTQTIALLAGSPAIDKGTSAGLTGTLNVDQRGVGYARKVDKSNANAPGGDGTDIGAFELGAQIKAVSRKTHGSAGTFNINLPLFGPKVGVECRKGGSSHVFQLVLTFPIAVTVGSVTATPDPAAPGATGSVSSATVNGKVVTVNLTGVSNAQRLLVTLFGVSDGTNTNDVKVPMGVLFCDTNNNGAVADTDVSLTQSKVGQTLSATNFREDVDLTGAINSTDVSLVTSNKGKKLP